MNKVILIGRLTKKPDVRHLEGGKIIVRYTLAVDRRGRKNEGAQTADFIQCVVFDKGAEFAEKYLDQGIKIAVTGRIQTGSYTNKDGVRIYTTDIVVEDQEFVESKRVESDEEKEERRRRNYENDHDGGSDFMPIPDDVDDGGLPFN